MQNMKLHSLKCSFTAMAAALVAIGCLTPVEAHARGRSKTVEGPRGGVYQRQISRTPGNLQASGSATLPNGKSATRSLSRQKTDTGRTTSARAAGFNGKSATYDSTTTRTDTGHTRQVNATGPTGATAAKQINVSKQDGVVTRSVEKTVTRP